MLLSTLIWILIGIGVIFNLAVAALNRRQSRDIDKRSMVLDIRSKHLDKRALRLDDHSKFLDAASKKLREDLIVANSVIQRQLHQRRDN